MILCSTSSNNCLIHVQTRTNPLIVSPLRRHFLGSSRNLPPPRTSAEAKGTFLALCLLVSQSKLRTLPQRSAGDHVNITLEPMGAGLLCNKKLIINWSDSPQCQRFQSKKVSLLNPVCVCTFTSTSPFSRRNNYRLRAVSLFLEDAKQVNSHTQSNERTRQ